MSLVPYLKPPAGHVHEHFRCCGACHKPTEPAPGVRHCPCCCKDVATDAEDRIVEHRGIAPYRWCLGGWWELPARLRVDFDSGKRLTLAQAIEAIDLTIARRFPLDLKTREVLFHVKHYQPNLEHPRRTYVEATAFSKRGADGKLARTRYRFNTLTGALLGETDDVPDHSHGICGPCTLRFRFYNGLGLGIDDVAAMPGYAPTLLDVAMQDQPVPTAAELDANLEAVAAIAKVDSKTGRRPTARDRGRELFT